VGGFCKPPAPLTKKDVVGTLDDVWLYGLMEVGKGGIAVLGKVVGTKQFVVCQQLFHPCLFGCGCLFVVYGGAVLDFVQQLTKVVECLFTSHLQFAVYSLQFTVLGS
jgi:hypothetical protein